MRYRVLDSLRGIAALGVVLYHCYLSLPVELEGRFSRHGTLALILQGRPFVILFFVLSGFALAASLTPAGRSTYFGYLLRRLCRIYLPYLAALALSLGIFYVVAPVPYPGEGWWLRISWQYGATGRVLLDNLLLLGNFNGATLDNVNWSLVYELRIAVLFPAFIWLAGVAGPVAAGLVGVGLTVAGDVALTHAGLGLRPYGEETPWLAVAGTAHFAVLFVFGAFLSLEAARFRAAGKPAWPLQWMLFLLGYTLLGQRPWEQTPMMLAGAGVMFALAAWPGVRRLELAWPARISSLGKSWTAPASWAAQLGLVLLGLWMMQQLSDAWDGVGSAILIYACIASPWLGWLLLRRVPVMLGRISYSLYLVHVPVLAGLCHLLEGRLPALDIRLAAILLALPLAVLMQRLVEAPAQKLGRVLAQRLFPAGEEIVFR